MDKKVVAETVLRKAMETNGGKMGGKAILILIVVGVVVVLGFLAYRLLIIEMITRM